MFSTILRILVRRQLGRRLAHVIVDGLELTAQLRISREETLGFHGEVKRAEVDGQMMLLLRLTGHVGGL